MARHLAVTVLVVILAFALVARAAAGEPAPSEVVEIETIARDGALTLAGDGRLCLKGIWVPVDSQGQGRGTEWQSAWRRIIENNAPFHRSDGPLHDDRYGCAVVDVQTSDRVSLADILLDAGWAAVDPALMAPDDADIIDVMLALEDQARRSKRGIWRDPSVWPRSASEASLPIGTRQLVEGRVRRVSGNDRYVYLNFGADWRTDFTTRLKRKMIEAAGVDAADLDGKKLRIRGVLQESRGPLIDITHLKQIEFLP